MLDQAASQAAGLLSVAGRCATRLMAVVSHGDEKAELPLLWRLCQALVNLGYTVTVLDATVCESESNPGLEQLMECAHLRSVENSNAPTWSVVPSGIGVHNLCLSPARGHRGLHALGRLFASDGIVILYSNAQWLVSLMGNSESEPLLAVSSMKNSLMTSYLALKRLLTNGTMRPTIVNLAHDQHAVAASLGECAKNFLGYEVKPITIAADADDAVSDKEMQLLALRLLENALRLTGSALPSVSAMSCQTSSASSTVRH